MIEFVTSAKLQARHGFFSRKGGVSSGPYASLNCSTSGADDPEKVRQNRALVAHAMGGILLGVKQVHGTGVAAVTAPWESGPQADAMVTAMPGIALGIVTADCGPILFASPEGVVGAAHAGWRGALAGVLEATLAAMRDLGATNIVAAIGPCIHQPSYEVSADLRDAVLARNPADGQFFADGRPGHWFFDLPGYCAARLAAAGVDSDIVAHDTAAMEDSYFSHRRRTLRKEAAIGHQISVICS